MIGSYFMVNGFAEGYCGIQVNSADERRILFSVWSPFETDNPDQIPAEAQVRLLARGDDVVTKEFGGEGSGGQSFLRYNWKAGSTYRFLTRVHPDENRAGATVYTTWFFAPERNNWRLIASLVPPARFPPRQAFFNGQHDPVRRENVEIMDIFGEISVVRDLTVIKNGCAWLHQVTD